MKGFKRAADLDDAAAQFMDSLCLTEGIGIEKNNSEGVKWFRRAAIRNNASAQLSLAVSFYNGSGVQRDLLKAVKWLRKVAEQSEALTKQPKRNEAREISNRVNSHPRVHLSRVS